jgi:WD40 repeat protein
METGELIQCMTYPCQENTSSKDGNIGAVIDPDRRWVFSYSESTISIGDLSGKTEGRLSLVNDLDTDYMWSIGAIAPDAAHDGYAIVFQEGKVWLDTVDRSASRYRTLVDGKKNDVQEVITAKFDPAGQWLAFIRGGYMSVWYLGKKPESLYLEEKVPQAVDLSFDHSGSLLFVGGGDKITIWDLTNKSIVAEHEASGITSLDISEDNRLLIWGDAQGAIHVWGIPAP